MSWLVEQQLCRCEGREHLAPTGGMALGRCRKLWPRPTDSATPHLLCLPRRCVMGQGAGLGRTFPRHHGISIKARKPAFSLSWTNASPSRRLKESPFPFAPLCTLPLRRGLPLSSRVGSSPRRWTAALSGQKACVPISEDGLAPTASGAFYVPAECRQSAHFFKNELPSSGWVLATGT